MSDLATLAEQSGTKFILALFVDLRGKPCAKLVPVEAVDLLATEGVGFAGYAVGAMGQEPKDPDLMAIPDPASFTPIPFIKDGLAIVHCDPHVNGEPWPYAPARDPQGADPAGRRRRLRAVGRGRGGVLPAAPQRRRQPVGRRRRRHRRAALLRRPWCHPDVRPPHRDLGGDEHARLVQLRQRPRGRQRPVRAELPIRRRADHRRPGGHAALPAVDDRRRTRHGGHLHAQALRRQDRQRFASASVADQRRHSGVPRRGRLPRTRVCPRPRMRSSAASSNTPARCRRWWRQRSTPTSEPVRRRRRRARRGRRGPRPTAATTARTTSGCPTRRASSCAAATAPPTRTWRSPRRWGRASTGSSAAPTPEALAARDVRRCRRRCCTPSTSSRATR